MAIEQSEQLPELMKLLNDHGLHPIDLKDRMKEASARLADKVSETGLLGQAVFLLQVDGFEETRKFICDEGDG